MSRRDPRVVLREVRDHALEAVTLLGDRTLEDLRSQRILELALTRLLEVVGEAARRMPENDRRRYRHIDWDRIITLRHRLAHGYDTVDLHAVWAITTTEFPGLIAQIDTILGPEEPGP